MNPLMESCAVNPENPLFHTHDKRLYDQKTGHSTCDCGRITHCSHERGPKVCELPERKP